MIAALVATGPATRDVEARSHNSGSTAWRSGFSTIVVDAKTGDVLHSSRADELRHPASLAKIMTLYLLFAEIEAGRLKLNSRIRVSAEAAAQPPSKLGLKPGQTISVEDAIKALITRSANDIAVAAAEAIAGDEESFAKLMTRRAHALGMTRTVFKNASGLPNPGQVTTARELAILSLALQDRFPKLYPYFATRTFHWRGVAIGNHNRLLGSVAGVDGIKTGYTRASGFNLATSAKRDGRHIVAIVLGGRTAAARDNLMRDLIAENIRRAYAGPRTAPRFAEALPPAAPSTTAAIPPSRSAPGSDDPIRPTPVRVVPVGKEGEPPSADDKPAGPQMLPISTLSSQSVEQPLRITPTALAPEGRIVTFAPPPPPAPVPSASAQASPEVQRTAPNAQPAPPAIPATPATKDDEAPAPAAPDDWIIQIGAFTDEAQARERLADARARAASILAKARPYTERTTRGSTEFFRARFAGFDETGAKRACETLKKSNFACFAARN